MNQKALVELAKSFGRFIWFGLLGLVGVFLTSLLTDASLNNAHVVIGGQNLNLGFLIVAGIGLAVKAIDRYIHTNDDIKLNGISPV